MGSVVSVLCVVEYQADWVLGPVGLLGFPFVVYTDRQTSGYRMDWVLQCDC